MKKVLSILLICIFCISCIACSNEEKAFGIKKKPESTVCEYLVDYIDEFNDPGSVTVVKATMGDIKGSIVHLKISAKNSYGGVVSSEYYLVIKTFSDNDKEYEAGAMIGENDKDYLNLWSAYLNEKYEQYYQKDGSITLDDMANAESTELDISYINNQLDKYKTSKGWI